ncbi:hypothetical protein EDB83DRAFT_737477 [Lactarius deliciosus]|nr:hypothetical protein EDB83DRAFT_737477 [Lactarius deliciosus]
MHSLRLAQLKLPWFFYYKQTPKLPPGTAQSECPERVTIGKLSDQVLLKIFCHYLDDSLFWPGLAHICRRWRRIVFASFRLHFTHGSPVSKVLDSRPALPIVVNYGGSLALDPPVPEDDDNIMAALKQSDRVISISLTVTKSLLEKLSAIERPFMDLEDLVLLSQDCVRLTLPSTFRWGPRLRCLNSTSIAFPALLRLLYSSTNLVDLQLHEVLYPSYLAPEVLTDVLSGMTQLQSLSLHFLSTTIYPSPPPPVGERAVLPALTRFNFRGPSKYLEGLVAIIDAPRLRDIGITFLDDPVLGDSKLYNFIDRIKMPKSHCRADIISSQSTVSISLIRPGATPCFQLGLFSESLSVQLSFMAQVCVHFSAFLFNVEDLRISATRRPRWEGSHGRWLELINSFTGIKQLHVAGNLSTHIVGALKLPNNRRETLLPALQKLYIPQPWPRHAPLREAVVSFMTSRRLSVHRIPVEYEQLYQVNEPRTSGTGPLSQQGTIEILTNDVLLDIFRQCLGLTPQIWPTLACVSQRWRQIVFSSPLGLNLRLICTYGAPVLKALDCMPAFPITVRYGGVPNLKLPSPEDD